MPFEYRYDGNLFEIEGKQPVGDGECVRLVQELAKAPTPTAFWRAGKKVIDYPYLRKGTAIATFNDSKSRYVNAHGNHAALFWYRGPSGSDGKPAYIWVIDQWKGRPIRRRQLYRYTEKDLEYYRQRGKIIPPSDNLDFFYVISR